MIYVTVGTMYMPFTRLLSAVDKIAVETDEEIIVQTGMDKDIPKHCTCFDFKSREEILEIQARARVVVSHAGIGSVIDALKAGKPLLVVPRLAKYREHTNDHQMDLAGAVERRCWGRMVLDMDELANLCANPPKPPASYTPAKEPLIATVREFLHGVQRNLK
jgi:UDP-N-acetylglucosamine transferase subunit ALG13